MAETEREITTVGAMNPVGTCWVCKRRHDNIGHQLSRSHPIKWFCRDCFSIEAAEMPKKTFDIYETASVQAGGVAACQYLDSIEQTDLAELTPDQWLRFFVKYAVAYEENMKTTFGEMVK